MGKKRSPGKQKVFLSDLQEAVRVQSASLKEDVGLPKDGDGSHHGEDKVLTLEDLQTSKESLQAFASRMRRLKEVHEDGGGARNTLGSEQVASFRAGEVVGPVVGPKLAGRVDGAVKSGLVGDGLRVEGPRVGDGPLVMKGSLGDGLKDSLKGSSGVSSTQSVRPSSSGLFGPCRSQSEKSSTLVGLCESQTVSGLVGESQSMKEGPIGASGPIGPSKGMGSSSNKGEVRSWAALFGTPNFSATSKLQFVPPKVVNGRRVVVPSEDIVNEGIKLWQCSLVGQFVDSRVPFPVLSRLVNRIWGHLEEPAITIMESGLIVFQFRQEASCDWILSNGPWHIGGKPLLLRKWFPGIVPQTFSFDSVPIWVKLSNLPLELWTSSGISVVASAVGRSVCLDKATEERRRLSFARVCVEIEPKDELPSSVDVCVRGTNFVIPVEYAWIPKRCSHCFVFGNSYCASRPKQGHVVSDVQPSLPSSKSPVAEVPRNGTQGSSPVGTGVQPSRPRPMGPVVEVSQLGPVGPKDHASSREGVVGKTLAVIPEVSSPPPLAMVTPQSNYITYECAPQFSVDSLWGKGSFPSP